MGYQMADKCGLLIRYRRRKSLEAVCRREHRIGHAEELEVATSIQLRIRKVLDYGSLSNIFS